MALAVYQKWSVDTVSQYLEDSFSEWGPVYTSNGFNINESYYLDSSTGIYSPSGANYAIRVTPPHDTGYTTSGSTLWEFYCESYKDGKYYIKEHSKGVYLHTSYFKGSTRYSDVIAEQGSLPSDGKSGTYWYVFVKIAVDVKVCINGTLIATDEIKYCVNGNLIDVNEIGLASGGKLLT